MNAKQLKQKYIRELITITVNETIDTSLLTKDNGSNSFRIKNPYIPVRVNSLSIDTNKFDSIYQAVSDLEVTP